MSNSLYLPPALATDTSQRQANPMPKVRKFQLTEDDLFDYKHEDWDDQDDQDGQLFQQKPMMVKNMQQQRQQDRGRQVSKPTRIWSTAPLRHQPDIPISILKRICYFCSLPSLRINFSLVCKQWYAASQGFIRRVGLWETIGEPYQDTLVERMTSLWCLEVRMRVQLCRNNTFGISGTPEQHRAAWEPFLAAITAPLETCDHVQDDRSPRSAFRINTTTATSLIDKGSSVPGMTMCLAHNITEITFRVLIQRSDDVVFSLLPHLRNLEHLHIHYHGGATLPLVNVLEECRALRTVGIYGVHLFVAISNTRPNESLPPQPLPERAYRLQSFVAENTTFRDDILDWLIDSCPDLRIFKATNTTSKSMPRPTRLADLEPVYKRAGERCRRLQWFRFIPPSQDGSSLAFGDPELRLLPKYMPWITHMHLTCINQSRMSYSVYPSWQPDRNTRQILYRLTHLELKAGVSDYVVPDAVNMVLRCAPALVHLWAPGVRVYVTSQRKKSYQYYDTFSPRKPKKERRRESKNDNKQRRREARGLVPQECPMTKHWQCTNLQFLDITYSTFFQYTWEGTAELSMYLAEYTPRIRWLTFHMEDLKLGQRVLQMHKAYPWLQGNKDHSGAKYTIKDSQTREWDLLEPLRRMESLESLTMHVRNIHGVLQADDFEYLRTRWKDADDDDSEHMYVYGLKHERIAAWPRLESFHVRYENSKMVSSYHALTAELQEIRPGVEFKFNPQKYF
ncbi:hypothetical protein BG011_000338 [Mortierella polycephala]|uniref:F-box domain-containing protein n=1 Tax=Mortierella polycephala TaxID=41804 RepID=A0A9P6TUW4_9FUNG|nr:hypothetical protein BG011_000338 [Mortierella polycephala]